MTPGGLWLTRGLALVGLIAGGVGVRIGFLFMNQLLPFAQGRPSTGEEYLPLLFSAACLLLVVAGVLFLIGSPEVWSWGLACQGLGVALGLLYLTPMVGIDGLQLMFMFNGDNFIYFGLPQWIMLYSVVVGVIFWIKRPVPVAELAEKPSKP